MAHRSTFERLATFVEQGLKVPDALRRLSRVGFATGVAARQWDDLTFPATAINPPGQASDPDWDNTKGGWLFDANGTEQLWVIAQMKHGWAQGSDLKPHFHWEKTTSASGTVLWRMIYTWYRPGVARAAEVTLDSTTPVADSDTLDVGLITPVGTISEPEFTISDTIIAKIQRVGGSDSYGADARLLEFDIHYQIDAFGSNQEFVK